MRREWPFVGRAQELRRLRTAVRRPDMRAAAVAGAVGAGKTRLAETALAAAADDGHPTAWAATTRAAASVPLGPFAALLPAPSGLPESRLALLRELSATISARGGRARTVLGVDDAHLLDDASAALLHQLAATGAAFVLLTLREDQPAPDAVANLVTDDRTLWVEVDPLRGDVVAGLVETVLEGDVDAALTRAVWDLSGGNPLLCRGLLEDGLDDGAIVPAGGRWRLRGPLSTGRRLARLLGAHLDALEDGVRAAAQVVALGEPVPLGALEGLVDHEDLAAAERAGILCADDEHGGPVVRVGHALLGALLRARTGGLEARAIRLRLARAIEARGGDLRRTAAWRLDGGDPPDAPTLLGAAALARGAEDYDQAARLATAAVEAGAGFVGWSAAAEAAMWRGDVDEARRLFARAEAQAPDDAARAAVVLGRAATELLSSGQLAAAERDLDRAERLARAETRGQIAALRGMVALDRGEPDAAVAAVQCWRGSPVGDLGRLAMLPIAVTAGAWAGRAEDAVGVAEQALAEAGHAPEHPYLADLAAAALASALLLSGDARRAAALADDRHRATLRAGGDHGRARWAFVVGNVAVFRGVVTAAVDRLEEAAALLGRTTSGLGPGARAQCAANLAEAYALTGDLDAAQAALADTAAPGRRECWHPETGIARAWVDAARGDSAAARRQLQRVALRAQRQGAWTFCGRAWHDVARLGRPRVAAAELRALAGRVQGRLWGAWTAHAAALEAGDADALEAAGAVFDDCGLPLLAGEAFAEAAAAHRAAGRQGAELAAAAICAAHVDACGGPSTPALQQAPRPPAVTPREREVATLAAGGAATGEIAERLGISTRTVENHLHRAYAKLGVHQRGDLAAALGLGTAGSGRAGRASPSPG